MTNKTKQYAMWLMTTILLITSAVNYCNAEIEDARTGIAQFDMGMDVDVQELMDAQSQTSKIPHPYPSTHFSGHYTSVTRDCKYIEFGPNSSPMSRQVFLESRYYERVCYTVGGNHGGGRPGPGNGHNDSHNSGYQDNHGGHNNQHGGYNNQHGGHNNQHGGYNNHPQTYCEDRLVHTERRNVQMEVNRGQIFPWEKDVFQVCLHGYNFNVNAMENASHTYNFSVNGNYDIRVTAMAGSKIPTRPDPNGIFVEGFIYEHGSRNFRLSLGDKWTNYYTGERTQISLKLKKDRRLWGDELILSKEMLLPAQERYEVDFASFSGEFSKPLESGQKYYVEWSFTRIGSVSKPINNEGGQTSRIILP